MKNQITNKKTGVIASILLALVVVACFVCLVACGEKDKYIIEQSNTKVDGVTITVNQELTKKKFSTEAGDSEARVNQFAKFGELDQITINVKGTVSKADCVKNAVARDAAGNEVGNDGKVNYYTDYFTLKIKVDESVTKLKVADGLPAKDIREITKQEDGYYAESIQWLLGDANQSNWQICGNTTSNDGYFYFAFMNDEEEIVNQYFVRVVYDVTFVD